MKMIPDDPYLIFGLHTGCGVQAVKEAYAFSPPTPDEDKGWHAEAYQLLLSLETQLAEFRKRNEQQYEAARPQREAAAAGRKVHDEVEDRQRRERRAAAAAEQAKVQAKAREGADRHNTWRASRAARLAGRDAAGFPRPTYESYGGGNLDMEDRGFKVTIRHQGAYANVITTIYECIGGGFDEPRIWVKQHHFNFGLSNGARPTIMVHAELNDIAQAWIDAMLAGPDF